MQYEEAICYIQERLLKTVLMINNRMMDDGIITKERRRKMNHN